jgi:hypothetical protein
VRKIRIFGHDVLVNRKDFQALSAIRIREARALAKLGMNDGAYYLAGYCVECALKACIAKLTQRHEFPNKKRTAESYRHSLGDLLKASGLGQALTKDAQSDPSLIQNWDIVKLWSPERRYVTTDSATTRELIEAVGNRHHGVLRWIKLRW